MHSAALGANPQMTTFSGKVFAPFAVASGLAALVAYVAYLLSSDADLLFVVVGMLGMAAISSAAMLKARIDPFEPIVLFAFTVLMGCAFRSVFFYLADDDEYMVQRLTNGYSLGALSETAYWVPLALLIFGIAYATTQARLPLPGLIRRDAWQPRRVRLVILCLCTISAVSTWALVRANNIDLFDLSVLSAKRRLEVETARGTQYATLGYLRWGADLAGASLFIYMISRCAPVTAPIRRATVFGALLRKAGFFLIFCVGVFWPIVCSSRTGILQLIFGTALIYIYFSGQQRSGVAGRRQFIRLSVLGVSVAVFVLASIGVWRQFSQTGEVRDETVAEAVMNNTVGAGNFMPLARTALIVREMGGAKDFALGETYAHIAFAPIPRTVWPDKPEMAVGLFVKREIYGHATSRSGYPPGMIGEAYINFGLVGVLIIPALLGAAVRILYNSFAPYLGRNRGATLVYSLMIWPIGFQLGGLDFKLTTVQTITAIAPAIVALAFLAPRTRGIRMPLPVGG